MSELKIGWAEENFVFEKPISLYGQFAERISQYTEKPIGVTALAIEADGQQVVFCSADLESVSCVLTDEIKNLLKDNKSGLDINNVILSATHVHTGPVYAGCSAKSWSRGKESTFRSLIESELPADKKYIEAVSIDENKSVTTPEEASAEIAKRAAKAILNAWENRKQGSFSNAFGRAAVGMCRRVCYSDGSAQMWGDANTAVFTELEGGNDSGIELLYFFDCNGKLTGVVANLACPAQCVQHRHFISPDFWGEAKMLLRKHFGEDIFLLPLCSAAGDQCPVDLIRWVEPESDVNDPNLTRNNPPKRKADPSMFDISGMKKAGKRVANEIIDVFEEGLDTPQSDAVFCHKIDYMKLPLRRATLAEATEARNKIREYFANKPGDVDFNDAAKLQVYLGILRRMEQQEEVDTVTIEAHIIRLGNIVFATNPFELFLDYANQMKARSVAEQTFVVQLAGGKEGYLPTEKAEKGGHYSAFISSGCVGHAGGEMLVRQTLQDIRELFEK